MIAFMLLGFMTGILFPGLRGGFMTAGVIWLMRWKGVVSIIRFIELNTSGKATGTVIAIKDLNHTSILNLGKWGRAG